MYAVIALIAVFLIAGVIFLISRGNRDTGQGSMNRQEAEKDSLETGNVDSGYLTEPDTEPDRTDSSGREEQQAAEEKKETSVDEESVEAENRDFAAENWIRENEEEEANDTTISLVALADSKEEAEHIAELYGIRLVSFSYGTAEYETTKDPQELIALGEQNGYPAISVNNTLTID